MPKKTDESPRILYNYCKVNISIAGQKIHSNDISKICGGFVITKDISISEDDRNTFKEHMKNHRVIMVDTDLTNE